MLCCPLQHWAWHNRKYQRCKNTIQHNISKKQYTKIEKIQNNNHNTIYFVLAQSSQVQSKWSQILTSIHKWCFDIKPIVNHNSLESHLSHNSLIFQYANSADCVILKCVFLSCLIISKNKGSSSLLYNTEDWLFFRKGILDLQSHVIVNTLA